MSDAVESGLGLPEVVRAAARALDASLVLIDRSSSVLAVAARSTADERALMANAAGVSVHELRVGDAVVGRLRLRSRSGEPAGGAAARRHDPDRLRGGAPARARPRVGGGAGRVPDRRHAARRDRSRRPRRPRRRARAGRRAAAAPWSSCARTTTPRPRTTGARACSPPPSAPPARAPPARSPPCSTARAEAVAVLLPGRRGRRRPRVAEAVSRELATGLHGFTFAVGHSRVAHDPVDLYRAGHEALLAANVAEARPAEEAARRARVRGHGRLPAAAARDERGPGRAAALLRRDGRAARGLRRAVRDRPRADARDVPGRRRQRRRHRAAAVHPPPHGPLPARARARPQRARRRLDRRPRAARARAEGDAGARHRLPAGPGDRGRRPRRPRAARETKDAEPEGSAPSRRSRAPGLGDARGTRPRRAQRARGAAPDRPAAASVASDVPPR